MLTLSGDIIYSNPLINPEEFMQKKLLLSLGLMAVFFLTTQDSLAAIYKYVDSDGLINFADDLQSVPAQYRSSAKIVGGEPDQEKAASQPGGKMPEAPTGTMQKSPSAEDADASGKLKPVEAPPVKKETFGKRVITSIAVVASVAFAFIILGILDIENRKIVTIVRLVLLWGVTVFLIIFHGGDVVSLFSSAGDKIESARQRSEEKGRKAARAAKTLDALLDKAEQAATNPADEESGK